VNNRLLLEKLNFNEPTPIQETGFKAIDNYESKESVLVFISKTGTGKTHAYLVPLINRILNNSKPFLVLVPTNELVIQVSRMIDEILDVLSKETETRQIKILSVISGLDYNELLRKTKRTKYDILVSTPAKIKYLIDNQINIKHYESVVLDEADMMFDLDFLSLID
jgi:ATP-dependent RNA helicase CshB